MAQITIDIQPDNKLSEIVNAVALTHGWTPASPLTKGQYAKRVVAKFVKDTYLQWEASLAGTTANAASIAANEASVTIE